MKRLIFLFFFGLCVAHTSTAQVKIGDNPQNIDASSVLELESTDKVLVITRVTTVQMNSISPLQGALVYNTDLQGVHYYDGTQWVNIGGGGTGGPLTAEAIVNAGGDPTIVITPTATGDNLEVAPNSISTAQIAPFGINGTTDIQPESIGVGKLAGDVITEFELSENSVGPLQIQNQNIDLGDFNNVAGFITAADVVSADAGNVIESRADGVYYNDDQLIMDIADTDQKIDDHITADLDTSLSNEIQNLTLIGTEIGLTDTAGTIDIGPLISAGGSDDQNIGPVIFNTTTNELSIDIEGGNPGTVSLAALAGGGADGSETKINNTATVTVAGTGTLADPYELTAVGGGGGGTTEVADQTTITGVGIASDPFTIEPGATGEFLSTDATGDVVWSAAGPGGSGTTEVVDGTLLIGTGAAASPFTINPGGPDQILRTNTAGDALAWVDLPAGSGDDNQTAAEVPFAPTTNTTSTDVQAAIEELQTDIDAFVSTTGQANTTSNAGAGGVGLPLDENGVDLPFKSINASTSGIISVTDDLTNFEVDLDINNSSITLDKIAPNGATADGEIIQWNTDLDGAGPLTDAGWEVVANAASTTLADGNIFVGDALNAPQGVVLSGDATIDNLGELTVAPEAIELTMLNQNGATDDGDIMQWNTDLDGAGPLNDAGWEVVANDAGHTGTANNVFFAGADGKPTDTEGNDVVGDDESTKDNGALIWDSSKRFSTGILYVGLKANGATTSAGNPLTDSNFGEHSKLVVAERGSGLPFYPLQVLNEGNGTGSGAGILFTNTTTGQAGGAALVYERVGALGQGDFHFLSSASGVTARPAYTDKVFSIENDGDVVLTGNIVDKNNIGATPPSTGATEDGYVLTNTPGGTVWAAPGGIGALAENNILLGDNLSVAQKVPLANVPLNRLGNPDGNVSMNGFKITNLVDPTAAQEAATKKYVDDNSAGHTGSAGGSIFFSAATTPFAPTEDNANLFWDNVNDRLGIGTNNPDRALEVNGEVKATSFGSAQGTAGQPAYSFHTNNDTDSGIYRQAEDEVAISAGGEKIVSFEKNGADREAIFTSQVSLTEELLDKDGEAGLDNQVLSSTGSQVNWVAPSGGLIQKGKITTGGAGVGEYTVTIPNQGGTNYVINTTVSAFSANSPNIIQVINQTATSFTVKIFELDPGMDGSWVTVDNATWFYTVFSLP